MSSIEKYIPASIKKTWHEWRLSMKKAEHEATGAEEINDHIEMAGWGVEEAEQKHKAGASMFSQRVLSCPFLLQNRCDFMLLGD
jgi:N-terminal acetyltransferase 2